MAFSYVGMLTQAVLSEVAGLLKQDHIAFEIGKPQHRQTTLATAQQFTWAAQQQILAGNFKAIGKFEDDFQSRPGKLGNRRLIEQHAH